MQPYKFKVKYKPGPNNIADPLSRLVGNQERKNKLTTRSEPSLYTVVNKHGNSLIVQSPVGARHANISCKETAREW